MKWDSIDQARMNDMSGEKENASNLALNVYTHYLSTLIKIIQTTYSNYSS